MKIEDEEQAAALEREHLVVVVDPETSWQAGADDAGIPHSPDHGLVEISKEVVLQTRIVTEAPLPPGVVK